MYLRDAVPGQVVLTWCLLVAVWLLMATNVAMVLCVRIVKRRVMMEAWEAGHKVGLASRFIPKSQVDGWLRESGIDPDSIR